MAEPPARDLHTGSISPAVKVIALSLVVSLSAVAAISRFAFFHIVLDMTAAALVVLPGIGLGLCVLSLLGVHRLPPRWQLLLGAALGLGLLATLVLVFGLLGWLNRPLWVGILMACLTGGLVRCRGLRRLSRVDEEAATVRERLHDRFPTGAKTWMFAAPFLVLGLLAASVPPGFIWSEEGFGYDVLEYHLQMPREYLQAGWIHYAPHNVYASFPANVEMLYLLAMIVLDDSVGAGTAANMIHLVLGVLTIFAVWVIGREWSPAAGLICALALACCGWPAYLSGLAYVEHGVLFFGMAAAGALLHTRSRVWFSLSGACAGFACGCKYPAMAMVAAPLALCALLLPGRTLNRRVGDCAVFLVSALATFSPWLIKNQVMTGNPVFPLANSWFQASPPGWGEDETQRWEEGHRPAPSEQTATARLGAAWHHILGDRYQRFGPMIVLLALGGLVGRPKERTDWLLVLILGVQFTVWLFATHLYARFAVPLLIPFSLLAGRSLCTRGRRRAPLPHGRGQRDGVPESLGKDARLKVVTCILLLGGAWNFAFAAKLAYDELPVGASASWIYEGAVPGYEYFRVINRELPEDAKILLVGDARAFYSLRRVDYCVVFNRSPLVEAVRAARGPGDVMNWLKTTGYTHVLVNWAEIDRLARSRYGFPRGITPRLLEELEAAGLRKSQDFANPTRDDRYVTLYQVPP